MCTFLFPGSLPFPFNHRQKLRMCNCVIVYYLTFRPVYRGASLSFIRAVVKKFTELQKHEIRCVRMIKHFRWLLQKTANYTIHKAACQCGFSLLKYSKGNIASRFLQPFVICGKMAIISGVSCIKLYWLK